MFETELRVRGYHCDAYGHVNNARYLEFFEECRWEFMQPGVNDKTFSSLNLLLVVYKINVHYKRPLHPNDLVKIRISQIDYSSKSISFQQEIVKDNKVCTTAEVQFVLLDPQSNKATVITDKVKNIFNSLITGK